MLANCNLHTNVGGKKMLENNTQLFHIENQSKIY